MTNNNKIAFANDLRGIAAVLVLISHFYSTFWYRSDAVSALIGMDAYIPSSIPSIVRFIHEYLGIFFSHYSVALFFIISGFVIPFSLEKYTTKQFIKQRLFRILPTYWFSLLYTLSILFIFLLYIYIRSLIIHPNILLRKHYY